MTTAAAEEEAIREVLHQKKHARLERVLAILALEGGSPKLVRQIKQLALAHGLREIKKWNVSDVLRKGNGNAILTTSGWTLTAAGAQKVRMLIGAPSAASVTTANVRKHLGSIKSALAKDFIEDGVRCFEQRLFRPAVVFSWVGAIAMLHDYVIANRLAQFNAEAKRRDSRWKDASTPDDLGRLKEHEFLDILESISVIGKNVKQVLQNQCLNLRNGCGHPNSLSISENNVAAHLDTLILNVYAKF